MSAATTVAAVVKGIVTPEQLERTTEQSAWTEGKEQSDTADDRWENHRHEDESSHGRSTGKLDTSKNPSQRHAERRGRRRARRSRRSATHRARRRQGGSPSVEAISPHGARTMSPSSGNSRKPPATVARTGRTTGGRLRRLKAVAAQDLLGASVDQEVRELLGEIGVGRRCRVKRTDTWRSRCSARESARTRSRRPIARASVT